MKTTILAAFVLLFVSSVASAEKYVHTTKVEEYSKPLNLRRTAGRIVSESTIEIESQAKGEVVYVAELGQQVNKGDWLIRSENKQLSMDLDIYKQELDLAKLRIETLEGIEKKYLNLKNNGASFQKELDELLIQKLRLQSEAGPLMRMINNAEYELSTLSAKAKHNSVVIEKLVDVAQQIEAGQSLLKIGNIDRLKVTTEVPIEFGKRLSHENSIAVSVFYDTDSELAGEIASVSSYVNLPLQTVSVDITFSQPPAELLLNQPVTVQFRQLEHSIQLFDVPKESIISDSNVNYLFKLTDNDLVARIPVSIISEFNERLVVTGGLVTSDNIVSWGAESLSDNDNVTIVQSK